MEKRFFALGIVIMLLTTSLLVTRVSAATCNATTDNGATVFTSDDMTAIRQAIAAGTTGVTIKVAGTCIGVPNGDDSGLYLYYPLTLRGGYTTSNWNSSNPIANPTTLDANQMGRVIYAYANGVVIENLTVRNGSSNVGAGILTNFARHGRVTLRSLVIEDNDATSTAGGIGSYQTDLVLENVQLSDNVSNAAAGLYHSCQAIDGIECATALLRETTFNNNRAAVSGGAMYIFTGTMRIEDSAFTNNTVTNSSNGGAIYVDQSDVAIVDTTFTNNSATNGQGGAIHNRYGMLDLQRVEMRQNSADNGSGGAIYNGRSLTITDSTLANNRATNGGALFGHGFEVAALTRTTLYNNSATRGGAIVNEGQLTIAQSTLDNNSAVFSGGGIHNDGLGNLTITQSTLSNNTVSSDSSGGGGLFNRGFVTMVNSTLSGNSAESTRAHRANLSPEEIEELLGTGGGGAIWNNDGTVSLTHVTVADNSADFIGGYPSGGGIHNTFNGTLNLNRTLIADNAGGDCVNRASLGSTVANWVEDASCNATYSGDPVLLPLADNAGTTETHALQAGSGAIDRVSVLGSVTVDQRSVARPQGVRADVGAFEWTSTPLTISLRQVVASNNNFTFILIGGALLVGTSSLLLIGRSKMPLKNCADD